MKFISNFYKTALHIAVEKENLGIIKLLLIQKDIDLNQQYILANTFLCHFYFTHSHAVFDFIICMKFSVIYYYKIPQKTLLIMFLI